MRRSAGEQIKNLLYRKLQTISEDVLEGKGRPDSEQMASLERLMQLVKMHEAAPPPRKRWPVIVIFGFILLTLSFLLFFRVPKTEIEMELEVSGISFELPARQAMTDIMELSALGVSGLKAIRLPRSKGREMQTLSKADDAIRLFPDQDEKACGTITLATLAVQEGTRISVHAAENFQQYRLAVKEENLTIRVNVHGSVNIALSDTLAEKHHFESPKSILLDADANEVDIDLTPPQSSPLRLHPQLSATHLSFSRIDEYMDANRTVVRRASTILSGVLYFNALNDRKRLLRSGEMLQFNQSVGELRTLQMQNGKIVMTFQGVVRGMCTGSGENLRSIMPTYLDWFKERHGLALLWGATIYFFGLFLGVLHWLGIKP